MWWRKDWRQEALKDLHRYGFDLTPDNRIVLNNNKTSTVVIEQKQGRLHARSTTGTPLWSGPRISAFLEAFWHATPNH